MQARAYRDLGPFDAAVAQLRDYFERLQGAADSKDPRHEE